MCGINIAIKDPEYVRVMNHKLSHRGESQKVVISNGIGLGHVRLAIQGLDPKFDCPYYANDELYLFNGEIFNYKDLLPPARSDVQVLAMDPRLFDGDFAIVKYSPGKKQIEVLTDQFGKRQLYYRLEENGKISGISSEIKALTFQEDQPDELYFQTVARFGYYFGGNRTLNAMVKKFPPGYRFTISTSGSILKKEKISWWNSIYSGNLYQKIARAVKNRLVSDVPVAFLYSGGLDSSIILHHLIQEKAKPKIFSCDNEDDLGYAKRHAKELGLDLKEVASDDYGDSVYLGTESAADLGSLKLNYSLFRAVSKNGYKVCLTADGADEVFSGYKRNLGMDFQKNDIFNELVNYHLPRLDRSAMAHTLEYRSPFTADYIINYGLSVPYEKRKNKEILRKTYRGILPDYIVDRPKVPLKSKEVKVDKEKERLELAKKWNEYLFEEFKRQ